MLRSMMSIGVVLTGLSGAMGYSHLQNTGSDQQGLYERMHKKNVQKSQAFGVVDLMQVPPKPRMSSLPQVPRGMATQKMRARGADFSKAPISVDELVEQSPMLKKLVEADRTLAKQSFWARIRQKPAVQQVETYKPRLSGIRERNFPKPQREIDPSALSGMSPVELFVNQGAIQRGMQASVARQMKDLGSGF